MSQRIRTGVVLALLLILGAPRPVDASHITGPDRVYFPETGHYLAGGFLEYWRLHGGVRVFGYPLTEELSEQGLTVQYFERAVFEWHPGAPDGWKVQLRRIGAELTADRAGELPFRPVTASATSECRVLAETRHRLCHGFRDFWERNGDVRLFGFPISEEFVEGGITVQWFERARFEYHPGAPETPGTIQLTRLGALAADRAGVERAPLPPSADVPAYDPALWVTAGLPASLVPPPGAPTGEAKWIEVDLSEQHLRAWEYDRPVFGTLVSTGLPQYPTPTGQFRIYAKLRFERMRGGTPGIDYYDLPNVPHTMYFYGGYAIHGAYWHDNFGHVMSHGCVNLPLDAAAWLYTWAPLGTLVWIHQ